MKINEILHGDCMDLMPLIPELNRDVLAIVDPPYGINYDKLQNEMSGKKRTSNGGTWKKYKNTEWDSAIPDKKYFEELFCVSENQIIWGGNYFIEHLKNTKCFILWDKIQRDNRADGELAWTSFDKPIKVFRYSRADAYINHCDIKIHPTQKPVQLYRWLLQNYAKPGQLILDTHSGSGSLACACHLEKYDFIAIEKDIDYYNDSVNRLDELRSQGTLF